MKIKYYIFSLVVAVLISFIAGGVWEKQSILNGQKYKVIDPLTIQAITSHSGVLPEGSILYEYSHGPIIDTFILFINTKNYSSLESVEFDKKYLIAPIDAYKK